MIVGAYDYFAGGAQAGRAFLFNTNGTLVTSFTNPSPATIQAFSYSVSGFGNDRVMIGTAGNVAYLYRTNGTLLTTFTNPVPAAGDNFGTAIAAVSSDRLLISAIDYGGAKGNGGSAYLFSTNGTLLTTFTNPAPVAYGSFGGSVAAVGSDLVLVGAWGNGAASLFALPYPPLSIARNAATVSLKWVTPETGLALQQAGVLGISTVWSNTSDSVSINGLTNIVQQTVVTTNRFFRLHGPSEWAGTNSRNDSVAISENPHNEKTNEKPFPPTRTGRESRPDTDRSGHRTNLHEPS